MTVAGSGAVQRWRRARADNITSDNEQGRSQSRDRPSLLPLSDHTGFLIQPEAHSTEDHDSTEVLSESEPMTNTRIMAEEEPSGSSPRDEVVDRAHRCVAGDKPTAASYQRYGDLTGILRDRRLDT